MMRKKKGLLLGLVAAMLLSGCGGGSATSESAVATDSAAGVYESYNSSEDVILEEAVEESGVEKSAVENDVEKQSSERKLIKTVSMDVETVQFDDLVAKVYDKAQALGGYIENSNISGNSEYNESTRNANFTIRIPKDSLEKFVEIVENGANVTNKNEQVEDVTLNYVDLESHKEALETEHERLLELMAEADDMDTLIMLESRLTEVRYQIQSMESQLRTYDNQVDYATINLYINEVARIEKVEKQSVWTEMATGFVNSLYNVCEGLVDFIVWFIVKLPYLIIWAAVISGIVFVIKKIIRKNRKKAQARLEAIEVMRQTKVAENSESDAEETKESGTE